MGGLWTSRITFSHFMRSIWVDVPLMYMCVSHRVLAYNQSVRWLFLLPAALGRRRRRLSRLCRRVCRCSGRARRRRIHKDFICHSKTDLLSLVHVEVVGPLVCLILPQPNLLCFITETVAKDASTVTIRTQLICDAKLLRWNHSTFIIIYRNTWSGYNFAGCWSDSGGMRMSSKKPMVTVKQKGHSVYHSTSMLSAVSTETCEALQAEGRICLIFWGTRWGSLTCFLIYRSWYHSYIQLPLNIKNEHTKRKTNPSGCSACIRQHFFSTLTSCLLVDN